jgi:multidrug efflux pump subunit AcrB
VSLEAIARFSLQRPLYVAFLALLCLGSGLWGFEKIGRLENPQFPVKNAYVITPYVGASAMEVELEVTDRIESALQELPYLEKITSRSVPGRSEVLVEVIETYDDGDLPQIWDELRRRVGEAARLLPPGAGVPLVEDDFGDVYGILYAIRSADYPPEFLRRTARTLSSGIKQIPGVAKVALSALPEEAVYLELGQEGLLSLGIPPDSLFDTIRREALVSDAGSALVDGVRLNLAADRVFHLEEQLEGLRFGRPGDTTYLRFDELGRVRRAPLEQPFELVRHNGEEVFILGVSVTQGKNVVTVGKAVETRLQEMLSILPVGIEAFPIYEQHKVVEEAVNAFMVNLAISIATVTGALCLFMGWRSGSVVGAVLLLTIMGTLGLMNAFSLELQRISLGALMIAMGMLVDNAIVVAEGMVAGIEEGKVPEEAAAAALAAVQNPAVI